MHVYSWQRFVCFMLIMLIALWIGTQWNCNNCVLAKGSVRALLGKEKKKKIHQGKSSFFGAWRETAMCYLNWWAVTQLIIIQGYSSAVSVLPQGGWKYYNCKINTNTHYKWESKYVIIYVLCLPNLYVKIIHKFQAFLNIFSPLSVVSTHILWKKE